MGNDDCHDDDDDSDDKEDDGGDDGPAQILVVTYGFAVRSLL